MSEGTHKAENPAVREIARKIRQALLVITLVVLTLFAVIMGYLWEPAARLHIFSEASIPFILALCVFLALIGLFLSVRITRRVLWIVRDYGNRFEKILGIMGDLREEVHGDILLEKIMDYAIDVTSSDAGSILLVDGGDLVFKIVRGEKASKLVGTTVEKGKGISGWVAKTGSPLRIADVTKDDRFSRDIDAITGYETRSALCVPLRTRTGVVGVIELLNKKGGYSYRDRDEEVIVYLAEQAATSIVRTKFLEDQKNYEIHLTDMLLEAIDFHMPEKRGHSRRVARYGNIIAKGIGMTEDEKKRLYFASLLHDVGFLKIHSDDSYRSEEFMKHPVVGYEMIYPINFYADIAPFILHHHERFDGHGYPSRLKGEDIPIEARIIAIAEAFDAMVSDVSYRVPVEYQEAFGELRRKAGTQFDPELVDIFVTNIDPRYIQE